jgi:hypothetical protein
VREGILIKKRCAQAILFDKTHCRKSGQKWPEKTAQIARNRPKLAPKMK